MSWVIMLSNWEISIVSALITETFVNYYEKLCDTDVIWFKESLYFHDEFVYDKFKKQLKIKEEGWYETGLVWKERNLTLGNNKNESLSW